MALAATWQRLGKGVVQDDPAGLTQTGLCVVDGRARELFAETSKRARAAQCASGSCSRLHSGETQK